MFQAPQGDHEAADHRHERRASDSQDKFQKGTAAALADELSTPLTPLEVAIGGSARRPGAPGSPPDVESEMAVWELLAYVMGEKHAPRPGVVVRWATPDRASARRWGERELARKVLGTTGRPSFSPPRVLERYVAAWEAAS